MEESEALVLESDGPRRRLVLPAAQPEDGGEFVCDAGDDSAFFTVTVTGGRSLGHPGEERGRRLRDRHPTLPVLAPSGSLTAAHGSPLVQPSPSPSLLILSH